MNYYLLDKINVKLSKENIHLIFCNENQIDYISLSTKSYTQLMKEKITNIQEEWDNVKKITNTYEYIHTIVPHYKYSVSKIKPISRAFFKLVEIYNTFNVLDKYQKVPLRSFHLAEGPGGFIEALSFMRKNSRDIYYGMTLIDNKNPNIPGWRKTEEFLKKHTNVCIERGADGTGDLYNPENLRYVMKNYKNTMDLVTGDGGFDFSVDFNKQERLALRLIYAQLIYSLVLQKKGGTFVLKFFDSFTKASLDIIYLLSCFYEKVYFMKPNTSRSANSEKYAVCVNFRYSDSSMYFDSFLNSLMMLNNVDLNKTSINRFLNININYKYLTTIREINTILGQQQIQNISKTIKLVENTERKKEKYVSQKMKNVNKCIAWCQKNKVPHNKFTQTNVFMQKEN